MLNVFFHTAFVFVDKMNLVSEWFDHTEIAGKTSQYWRLDGWQMEEVFFGYLPLSQGGPVQSDLRLIRECEHFSSSNILL